MSSWIQRAVSRFDAAAHGETDDAATRVQRLIAEDLAVRVSGLGLPPHPRVLEVGCGSGYLTAALVERLSEPHVTATDNSPAMVRATAGLALPGVSTHVMDGENPDAPAERFDLVCTSLAAQGFSDLQGSMQKLMRCVKPGGYMAVATLGCHTFHEWREAARKAGVEPHDRGYPSAEALADMMGEGTGVEELTPVVSSMSGSRLPARLESRWCSHPCPRTEISDGGPTAPDSTRIGRSGRASLYHLPRIVRHSAQAAPQAWLGGFFGAMKHCWSWRRIGTNNCRNKEEKWGFCPLAKAWHIGEAQVFYDAIQSRD